MFKRRKKIQPEVEAETTVSENTINTDEEVVQEIVENVTIFEAANKEDIDPEAVPSDPTVRIPDLKELTDDLVLLEETTDETATNEEIEKAEEELTEELAEESVVEEPEETTAETVEESSEDNSTEELLTENEQEAVEETPEPVKKKPNKLLRQKKKSSFRRRKEWQQRLAVSANILMWVCSVFLFVFCLSNLYQQVLNEENAVGFFDVGNAVVVSESMVPVLEKNDFIVYKATEIEKLSPEDIVVYKRPVADGHILIVHRLLAITDGYAITKGDNNVVQDEPFEASNIVGKVVFTIPQLGALMESLSSVMGIATLVALFIILTVSQFIYRKLTYQAWLKKLAVNKDERKAIKMFLDM